MLHPTMRCVRAALTTLILVAQCLNSFTTATTRPPRSQVAPVVSTATSDSEYTIIDLGTLGGADSIGNAINSKGEVTGQSSLSNQTASHAFLYTNGQMQDIGTLGGTHSSGDAINSAGQVTGIAYTGSGNLHAFFFSNGQMQDLGTFGGRFSVGLAINSAGQVTGNADLSGNTAHHAFLFTNGLTQDLGTLGGASSSGEAINSAGQVTGNADTSGGSHAFLYSNGKMQDLGTLGGTSSFGRAINSMGQVTGLAYLSGQTEQHAFLYSNGQMQDLGTLGGTYSEGVAINSNSQITGHADMPSGGTRAFLYSDGHMKDLGTLGGADSVSLAINSAGQVVGQSRVSFPSPMPPQPALHAFVYDSNKGMRDLNNLIPENSGWTLGLASAINDSGQITGQGTINNAVHAFLLTPRRKEPLIFIPGIAGSYLWEAAGGNNLWLGHGVLGFTDYSHLILNPNPPKQIYADDAIRAVTGFSSSFTDIYGPLLTSLTTPGKGGFVEYQLATASLTGEGLLEGVELVNGYPRRLTESGCDFDKQKDKHPNLFVFPYDWRLDIGTNAVKLRDYVQCVEKFYPGSKVNILTHSTGGLMARSYILQYPQDHNVDKLISISAPWLGAPKAINVLETGEFFENIGDDILAGGKLKQVADSSPGAHGLLPSSKYFDLGGRPFFEKDWSPLGGKEPIGEYRTPQLLQKMLNTRYAPYTPGDNDVNFHTASQDDFFTYSTPGVTYYNIYGDNGRNDTIGEVFTIKKCRCTVSLGPIHFNCRTDLTYDTTPADGDGTVPRLSAERKALNLDLNDKSVCLQKFTPANALKSFDHTTLTANDTVFQTIMSDFNTPSKSGCPEFMGPSASKMKQQDSIPLTYYLRIFGPVSSIAITDASGIKTAPPSGSVIGQSLPGVSTTHLGSNSALVAVSADQTYTVTFTVGGEPLELDITQRTANSTSRAIRYLDLSLPPGVNCEIVLTPQEIDSLRYDKDADGVFETQLTPAASVSGAAAQDTNPPFVQISATGEGNNSIVTIATSDSGSGVKATYYSIDGTNFQPYTGPFTVNFYQGPVVYAFADDNVANRSGLVTYYPSITPNQLDNAQFFVRQHYLDFLNREPDSSGLGFWINTITSCGSDQQCIDVKRINASAAYFLSIEFQQTGYLVYRIYKASFGNITDIPNASVPIKRQEFLPDTQEIGNGVIVNQGNWQQQLEANKQAFTLEFVQRSRFTSAFPTTMTPAQFVDKLFSNAGVTPSATDRNAAVAEFGSATTTGDVAARSRGLRDVAENATLNTQEFNRAFVLMQYFGYLRRNPYDPPEQTLDYGGFNFWLGKLNGAGGDYIKAEMVKAFISSDEYRHRFGP